MRARQKKAERILSVREQMLKAEQARLAEIVREQASLDDTRRSLLETFNNDLFGPLMLEQACRHLDRLATQSARAKAAQNAQETRVREEGLASKLAERAAETAARHARSAAERAAVQEIAEASALKPPSDASLA